VSHRLSVLLAAFIAAAASYAIQDPSTTAVRSTKPLRVLFIGNSYTFVNDLPHTFAVLALSGGHAVEVEMAAEGGWTLQAHADSPETIKKIEQGRWDYVVLQEQSQLPASPSARKAAMFPAARELARRIRKSGATPLLFQTWAHRDGWAEQGLRSADAMQAEMNRGYLAIAKDLETTVVPAGEAWALARRQKPPLDLWQADGSHPNELGAYLTACVFYGAIFHENPSGLPPTAPVSNEMAKRLQGIAARTVLEDSPH
jgi:hypothetical protein